jgi:hypothetical protein
VVKYPFFVGTGLGTVEIVILPPGYWPDDEIPDEIEELIEEQ